MTLRKNKISRKRASSNRAKKTKKQVGGEGELKWNGKAYAKRFGHVRSPLARRANERMGHNPMALRIPPNNPMALRIPPKKSYSPPPSFQPPLRIRKQRAPY
jgi:hypothetical protein